ncbi:MAG: dihydrofolate reductase [Planctomycetes bacterium]|nr:dihydrofolate reductase [Planctomycetota bacterium]
MRVTLVIAADEDGVIGKDGQLPWRLPADLAHFKRVTMGHPIVMGRKTWESIGRALPGRFNIVISRKPGFEALGAQVVSSLEAALWAAGDTDELMVIGGAEIYRLFHDRSDRIHLTRVHAHIDGDTHLPQGFLDGFVEVSCERREADARNGHSMSFLLYERNPNDSAT